MLHRRCEDPAVIGLHQTNPDDLSDVEDLSDALATLGPLPPLDDPVFARHPRTVSVPDSEVNTSESLVELSTTARIALLNLYRFDPLGGPGGWPGTEDRMWVRSGVLERLTAAAGRLPDGFGLALYDTWRNPSTVRALYEHFYGPHSTLAPGFLADPDDPNVVAPHTTGGAVDVTLTWQGTALALGTVFDDFSSAAHLRSMEHLAGDLARPGSLAANLRRLLHHHLAEQGFVAMVEEWWHVSWGDQDWAAANGLPAARYGATSPR